MLKERVVRHMRDTGDYLLTIEGTLPQAGCLSAPAYPDLKKDYDIFHRPSPQKDSVKGV